MAADSKQKRFEQSRRHPRIAFVDTPWAMAIVFTNEVAQEFPLRLEAKNISQCGLKFISNYKQALFNTLRIQLYDRQTRQDPIEVIGTVVRVEETDTGQGEKTFGLALEFKSLDPSTEQRLAKVLSKLPPI